MSKRTPLEGGLEVELKDGRLRQITMGVWNGKVHHRESGVAFGAGEITEESEFRNQLKRIVSRSRYSNR